MKQLIHGSVNFFSYDVLPKIGYRSKTFLIVDVCNCAVFETQQESLQRDYRLLEITAVVYFYSDCSYFVGYFFTFCVISEFTSRMFSLLYSRIIHRYSL